MAKLLKQHEFIFAFYNSHNTAFRIRNNALIYIRLFVLGSDKVSYHHIVSAVIYNSDFFTGFSCEFFDNLNILFNGDKLIFHKKLRSVFH